MNARAMDKGVLGKIGEVMACEYLRKRGYRILERNFRTPYGEIDIIAKDGPSLAFVEVKTRGTDVFGSPLEAIRKSKKMRMKQAAYEYFNRRHVMHDYREYRFDAVGVLMKEGEEAVMDLVKGAFYSGEIL